ncbi:hypothetical protein [Botrimarina sp.]|uniref:hypothetical protein n=1 Tax=Botrimarina sp. TaxID=2795802 RepID=UPI0032EEF8FE
MRPSGANAARRYARLPPAALGLTALGLLALAGCRSGERRVQTELFQRELRLQEDEIYRLEDYIEDYQAIIRNYRSEVEQLKKELAETREAAADAKPPAPLPEPLDLERPPLGSRRGATTPPPALQPSPAGPELDGAADDPPDEPLDPDALIETPDELGEPAIEVAPPATTPATTPDPPPGAAPPPGEEAPPFQPGLGASRPAASPADAGLGVFQPNPVAQTSGHNPGVKPPKPFPLTAEATPLPLPAAVEESEAALSAQGADGIAVRVESSEPGRGSAVIRESRRASLAGFTGEASVLLVDPTAGDGPQKLARWDFSSREVDAARTLGDDLGHLRIELPLALPEGLPTGAPLRVWVRLVDSHGRKRLVSTDATLVGSPPRFAAAGAAAR